MAEPAELLLIKSQYELALHALGCGLAAEESNQRPEALDCFRKGHLHLIQGLEVPTGGESHQGVAWDTARLLQHKMRDTLRTVNDHISALENSQSKSEDQRGSQMNTYPDLAATSCPSLSSVHHLYPSIPAVTQNKASAPTTVPLSPAIEQTGTLPAAAVKTESMDGPADQPPAYTPKPTDGHCSLAYGPIGPVRSVNQNGREAAAAAAAGDEHELLRISSGVQLFFVGPDGEVSALMCPGYLRIIAFESQHKDTASGKPSSFLHVCDQMYPLTTDTPVLLANSGIFMLPDTMAEVPGSYVGIVLSSELPAADHELFQDLLSQLADLKVQDPEETGVDIIDLSTKVPIGPLSKQTQLIVSAEDKEKLQLPGWSEKMAHGILSGATRLSQSLAKGAEATGSFIHKGAAKIRDNITPEDTPSEVSPQVAKRLHAAKQATGGAVRVSQFLVNGLSNIAEQVADKVAPHVKKHGSKLVPESLKKSQDGHASNWDGTKFVAASGLHGFSTVWSSLENGAKKVCKSVATETVTTVKYKYGHNTGQATDTALQSVANIGLTVNNIDNFGLKAFLKSVGEKSANTVLNVKDIQPAETEEKGMSKAELCGHMENEMERREQSAKGKNMEKEKSQTEADSKDLQSKKKEL